MSHFLRAALIDGRDLELFFSLQTKKDSSSQTKMEREDAPGQRTADLDAEDEVFWERPEPTTRKFSFQQVRQLLVKMEENPVKVGERPAVATVFRFKEFPYNRGGRLREGDREVQREYWLWLSGVEKRCVPGTRSVAGRSSAAGVFWCGAKRVTFPSDFPLLFSAAWGMTTT